MILLVILLLTQRQPKEVSLLETVQVFWDERKMRKNFSDFVQKRR